MLMKILKSKLNRPIVIMVSMLIQISGNAQNVTIDGLKYYLYPKTHEAALDYGNTWSGELNLPSEVSYEGKTYDVKSMSYGAFHGCKKLTKIRIPKTIENVIHHVLSDEDKTGAVSPDNMNPFVGCTALECINVDEDNPIMSSIEGILFNKDGTKLYSYPVGVKAESYAVPDGVIWIGSSAFESNEYLISVELPETIERLYGSVFRDCKKLEKVSLPSNLTCLEPWMFWGCSSLKSIQIPSGVNKVGERAFWNCSSLREIDIPESVSVIGSYAFYGCMPDALVIRGRLSREYAYNNILTGLNESTTLYVPISEIDYFKPHFSGTILPVDQYHTADIVNTPSSKVISHPLFDLRGRRLETSPKKGVFIYNGHKYVR